MSLTEEKKVLLCQHQDQNSGEEVYGIVRNSPPQQQQQQQQQQQPDNVVLVRDPAKEIYGLLRSSGRGRQPQQQQQVFGTVRTHAPEKAEPNYLVSMSSTGFNRR